MTEATPPVVTTMFDFYGMPGSWPGRKKARRVSHAKKAPTVEQAILEDVAKQMGPKFNRKRFLPYIQIHEFEALLFSRPETIAEVLPDVGSSDALQAIRDEFRTPEEIDDDPQTAPSKRIRPIQSTIGLGRHGIMRRLENEPPRVDQVDGELTFAVLRQLVTWCPRQRTHVLKGRRRPQFFEPLLTAEFRTARAPR